MTMSAALEVWNETELRRQILRIANHRSEADRKRFYGQAWALITRLRQGRSPEYYLARVVAELCPPRERRPVLPTTLFAPNPPKPLKSHPCHWGVADICIGADCVQFKVQEKTCKRDNAFFERLYGPGAPGPRYE